MQIDIAFLVMGPLQNFPRHYNCSSPVFAHASMVLLMAAEFSVSRPL